MSFPSAFSLELKRILSAKQAHDYSCLSDKESNYLLDSKKFQCGENCLFKLTLTNFGNKNYNKTPYFTPGMRNQGHSLDSCQLMVERYKQREKEENIEEHISFYREKNKLIIDLDLVRGMLAKVNNPKQKDGEIDSNETESQTPENQSSVASNYEKTFRSHIKHLSTLVNYFLEFEHGEKYSFYNKNGQEINLKNYVVNLAHIEQHNIILTDPHIYHDNATVSDMGEYFLVRFHSEVSLGLVITRPTITINKELATHHGVKGKLKILEKASKDNEPLRLFFFGKFRQYKSKYINPDVSYGDILDYLVIS